MCHHSGLILVILGTITKNKKLMKKYIISTAIVLAAIASVSAEGTETRSVAQRQVTTKPTTGAGMMMVPSTITTGDAATDAKIKVLQAEMEAKVKAIHEEYYVKIKALVGDKKVNTGNDMMNRGSSTMRMGMRGASSTRMEDRDERRGTSTMMHRDGEMMNGSGTPEGRPERMDRGEGQVPAGRQVKGESTGSGSGDAAPTQTGVRGFFGRLFGR
jgi:hypothetical protein